MTFPHDKQVYTYSAILSRILPPAITGGALMIMAEKGKVPTKLPEKNVADAGDDHVHADAPTNK
jgi:hypothetical protein